MITNKQKPKNHLKTTSPDLLNHRVTFLEHLYEMRRRLFYVAVVVVAFGTLGYVFQTEVIAYLLAPAKGQQFIYTSPGGGINFVFQVCTYMGILMGIPVIMYQLLSFIAPMIRYHSQRFLVRCTLFSVLLAITGLAFGYYIGLPSALHFLSNQFTNQQIKALFTLQEYMKFATVYLVGSALLFQIPLIMLFINRIKPLKPSKLFKIERYVIVVAFILAGFITPTPDIMNQSIIAVPIIAIYQLGIGLVWVYNRGRPSSEAINELIARDSEIRSQRQVQQAYTEQLSEPVVRKPLDLSIPPVRPPVRTFTAVAEENKRRKYSIDGFGAVARPSQTLATVVRKPIAGRAAGRALLGARTDLEKSWIDHLDGSDRKSFEFAS